MSHEFHGIGVYILEKNILGYVQISQSIMYYRLFAPVQLACLFPRISYTSSSIYLHSSLSSSSF